MAFLASLRDQIGSRCSAVFVSGRFPRVFLWWLERRWAFPDVYGNVVFVRASTISIQVLSATDAAPNGASMVSLLCWMIVSRSLLVCLFSRREVVCPNRFRLRAHWRVFSGEPPASSAQTVQSDGAPVVVSSAPVVVEGAFVIANPLFLRSRILSVVLVSCVRTSVAFLGSKGRKFYVIQELICSRSFVHNAKSCCRSSLSCVQRNTTSGGLRLFSLRRVIFTRFPVRNT